MGVAVAQHDARRPNRVELCAADVDSFGAELAQDRLP
jgi:hypothetical protein